MKPHQLFHHILMAVFIAALVKQIGTAIHAPYGDCMLSAGIAMWISLQLYWRYVEPFE